MLTKLRFTLKTRERSDTNYLVNGRSQLLVALSLVILFEKRCPKKQIIPRKGEK